MSELMRKVKLRCSLCTVFFFADSSSTIESKSLRYRVVQPKHRGPLRGQNQEGKHFHLPSFSIAAVNEFPYPHYLGALLTKVVRSVVFATTGTTNTNVQVAFLFSPHCSSSFVVDYALLVIRLRQTLTGRG